MWVSGVLNYRDDVGPLLGHIDEIPSRTMGEFHSIHKTFLQSIIRLWATVNGGYYLVDDRIIAV